MIDDGGRKCENCERAFGALERGLQRDGHLVCAECAKRLDVERIEDDEQEGA